MYLSNFRIQGFQSYRAAQDLRLERNLTTLAGRNNVGKSALLRGLFLATQAYHQNQGSIRGVGRDFQMEYTWAVSRSELMERLSEQAIWLINEIPASESYILQAVFGPRPDPSTLPSVDTNTGKNCILGEWHLLRASFAGTDLNITLRRASGAGPITWLEVGN